jgi:high affinity Mn2+ porin
MNPASGCSPNPLRSAAALDAWANPARINLIGRLGFALAVLAAGVSSYAQPPDSLPSAPEPQSTPVLLFAQAAPYRLTQTPAQDGIGKKATDMSPVGREPQDAPITAMFSREDSNTWWLSGQANIIFQGRLPFHSLYQGKNSFRNSAEYKTSMVGTVYTAWRPTHSIRYNNDLIFDIEAAEGRGLSEAFGLAGFTNLDVVRNPNLGRIPYIARYQIHQVFGFTNKTTGQEPGFFALAPSVPLRRVEFRIGKLTLPDFFDVNGPGGDSHLQFMNWTVDNNGAWDYAADTRGYTVGGMAEYDDRVWSIRYGLFAMPTVANGIDMDWAFSRAHGQNGEFELRHSFVARRKGVTRLLFYANRAHMGTYREAIDGFLNGTDTALYGVTVPTITLHEHFSALKYGFGYNTEQEVTENLRVFGRFGWNEGQHESFAYTEVDQTVELGADYTGTRWHRPVDKVGVAVVSNAIKADHQEYLKLGGLGFLLGDGNGSPNYSRPNENLNYGRENIVESYYTWHFWRGLSYSLDVQHIDHPGYNRDRGPAWVGSVRAHVDF